MQFDQDTAVSLMLVILAVVAVRMLPRWLAGVPFVPVSELKQKLDAGEDVVVIDVRTEAEFLGSGGHVPGAINMPVGEVASRLAKLGGALDDYKSHPVYAMCRTDQRAAHAARALKKAGFSNLKVVQGGMKSWSRANYPSETR